MTCTTGEYSGSRAETAARASMRSVKTLLLHRTRRRPALASTRWWTWLWHKYAPLPAANLGQLLSLLCVGAPQWRSERAAALARARQQFHPRPAGRYRSVSWPADESPGSVRWRLDDEVRLLTPFDPVVWDRRRFHDFLGIGTIDSRPTRRRSNASSGYYALPLLWRDRVDGVGKFIDCRRSAPKHIPVSSTPTRRGTPPSKPGWRRELARMNRFLGLSWARPHHFAALRSSAGSLSMRSGLRCAPASVSRCSA